MPDMDLAPIAARGAAWAAALALTLLLAARLTPRGWWRRPNLRALAVLAGGTCAFGMLFSALLLAALVAPPVSALASQPPYQPPPSQPPLSQPATHAGWPAPGGRYLVIDDLNLRDGNGVRAQRVAVLRAGSAVVATGSIDGDWWQVRARVDGRAREGWASSLWLRRADEGRSVDPPGARGGVQAGTKRIGL